MKQHTINETQSKGERSARASQHHAVGVSIQAQHLGTLWQRVPHVVACVQVGRTVEGPRPDVIVIDVSVVRAVRTPSQLFSARVQYQLLRHVEGVAIKHVVRIVRNDDRHKFPPCRLHRLLHLVPDSLSKGRFAREPLGERLVATSVTFNGTQNGVKVVGLLTAEPGSVGGARVREHTPQTRRVKARQVADVVSTGKDRFGVETQWG